MQTSRSSHLQRFVISAIILVGAVLVVWWLFFSLSSPIPATRSRLVINVADQASLAKSAVEDEDSGIRKEAVEKLMDQTLLAKIAVEDKDTDVRKAAVEKLTGQTLLAKFAMEDKDWEVREAAVKNLTDQVALAKVAAEDEVGSVRKAAMEKLTDQAILANIAVEDKDSGIRELAVEKLTDQAVLAKIAVDGKYMDVRDAAFEKLTDQISLAKVAVEGQESDIRQAALEKLTDQIDLAKVAVETPDSRVRVAAFERLTDQGLLTKIAVEDMDSEIREEAMEKLANQVALAKVAVKDENSDVRAAAFGKINHARLLASIVDNVGSDNRDLCQAVAILVAAVDSGVPKEHSRRIKSELAPLICAFMEPAWRNGIGHLTSLNITWTAMTQDYQEYNNDRLFAFTTINGEKIKLAAAFSNQSEILQAEWESAFPLKAPGNQTWQTADIDVQTMLQYWIAKCPQVLAQNLATSAQEAFIRAAAVENLTDQGLLATVALGDKDWLVRDAAKHRLGEIKQ